jgi:hypothetical protein
MKRGLQFGENGIFSPFDSYCKIEPLSFLFTTGRAHPIFYLPADHGRCATLKRGWKSSSAFSAMP